MVHEYNQLRIGAKTLRVSQPVGTQRETYFLQLPLRWAIPLDATGGILHWLLSQTIFLVRKDRRYPDGQWNKPGSIAACGVSGSAGFVFTVVLIIFHVVVIFIGTREFVERVSYAGSYTWAISAACHPPVSGIGVLTEEIA